MTAPGPLPAAEAAISRDTSSVGTRRRNRALAVVLAVAVPVLIWVLTVSVAGHDLKVAQAGKPPLEIPLGLVAVFAAFASLAGWALLAALEKWTRRGRTIWLVAALFMLLVSFLPLTGPGTPAATRLVLASMHVAVAAAIIPVFFRTSPAGAPRQTD